MRFFLLTISCSAVAAAGASNMTPAQLRKVLSPATTSSVNASTATTSPVKPVVQSPAPPTFVRLSSGEFVGLMTICRYVEQGGALEVTLATGVKLKITNAADIKALRHGLGALNSARQVELFWPAATVAVNLDQVTNVWNDARGFTFWGTDGDALQVPQGVNGADVWKRLREQMNTAATSRVRLVEATPTLVVNPRHVSQVSIVDGTLRFVMSNKTWPLIEAAADMKTATKALEALSRPSP